MSNINSHQSNIEFIPAICPSCGGELRVPENRETIKCMYCGVDIILQAKETLGDKPNLDTIAHLTTIAIQGKNYSEAYHYCSMALEIDHTSKYGWATKGLCAAWLSNPNMSRFDEAIHCIQEALLLGMREDQDMATIFLSLADSVEVYTHSVITDIGKEYEERLFALGSGTPHVDVQGILQLTVSLTDKFFTKYGETIEKTLNFVWQNLPNPMIARKIRFLQWKISPIACPWLYTLDYRLTQGIACPQFITDLLSTISNSGEDPFGENAKEEESRKNLEELKNKMIESDPSWKRYYEEEIYDNFVLPVLFEVASEYHPNFLPVQYKIESEYNPLEGCRIWFLVGEKDEIHENASYYKNGGLLGVWLIYDKNNQVDGFELHRRGYELQRCGSSEKELRAALFALEDAEKHKQYVEKVRMDAVKLKHETLENEESQGKRKLQKLDQLPWWKKLFP